MAGGGEGGGYAPGPGAPLDDGPVLLFGESEPEGDVAIVAVLQIVEVRQGVVFGQGAAPLCVGRP